jgi:hypothetical protein
MYSCPVPNYEFNPSIIFPFFRFPIFMGVSYTDVLFLSGQIRFRSMKRNLTKLDRKNSINLVYIIIKLSYNSIYISNIGNP